MRNFQDTFETRKRSFISTFSICMTVPLMENFIFCAVSVFQARRGYETTKTCLPLSYLKKSKYPNYRDQSYRKIFIEVIEVIFVQ